MCPLSNPSYKRLGWNFSSFNHQYNDYNLKFQGTPLQVACKYGSNQVVPTLLDAGAWLESEEVPIYDSNSPFYLASAYGHYGVIEALFVYQPSMSNRTPPLGEKQFELLACCKICNCINFTGGCVPIISKYFIFDYVINSLLHHKK